MAFCGLWVCGGVIFGLRVCGYVGCGSVGTRVCVFVGVLVCNHVKYHFADHECEKM